MSETIRAILVDDEESARDVLENLLIRFCPKVQIVAKCTNVEDAVYAINQFHPDVVFLDIEMPNYAGYELVSFFEEVEFDIIFVTAYDQYAVKAFEISAVDYLLKPIDVERLKNAVEKLVSKQNTEKASAQFQVLQENLKTHEVNNIILPFQGGQKVISVEEIIAIEAQESYTNLYTTDGETMLVSKNLKHFENILADNRHFFRTHKSWIINLDHLFNFSKSKLEVHLKGNITAKLSKYKKAEFETELLKKV